ncbi:MAG: hypothetical protein ACC651_13895 [Candidatus Scalindua sp.]
MKAINKERKGLMTNKYHFHVINSTHRQSSQSSGYRMSNERSRYAKKISHV